MQETIQLTLTNLPGDVRVNPPTSVIVDPVAAAFAVRFTLIMESIPGGGWR